jgi:cell division septation protein DedD
MRRQVPLAAALVLAACTTRTPPPPPARPAPAAELSPIHQNLGPLEAAWHVRAGLNVAALSCSTKVGQGIITDYNSFLASKKQLLARAYEAKAEAYKVKGGNWQRALDSHMTQLYNQFADPDAQAGFCQTAAAEVKRAIAEDPDAFAADAQQMLARLDRPFTSPPQIADMPSRAAPQPLMAQPAAAAVPADWRIQLGAFSSAAAAQGAWTSLKARSPQFAAMTPYFEPVPGKPLVRLQVKGVETRADAIRLCAYAAAGGFDCIPVKAG